MPLLFFKSPQQIKQNNFLQLEATMVAGGTPRILDHGTQAFDVDPADNHEIMSDPAKRRAFLSTVMLVGVNGENRLKYFGSGTVLVGYQVGGLTVIVSIRHVTDLAANGIPDGAILGLIKPEHGDKTLDYPTLSYFDKHAVVDHTHVNIQALKAIPGVEIAPDLPPGMITGQAINSVATEGASGGGRYNAAGQLVGVLDGNNLNRLDLFRQAAMVADSPLNGLFHNPQPEQVDLPLTWQNDIQSLAFGSALEQLASLSGHRGESNPQPHETDVRRVEKGFDFGFPDGIPMFFDSLLTYNPTVANEVTAELSEGLTDPSSYPTS